MSIGKVDENACETTFRKDDGTINHLPTGNHIDFVRRAGVYFVRMQVPRALTNPDMDFGRLGLAP